LEDWIISEALYRLKIAAAHIVDVEVFSCSVRVTNDEMTKPI